jgi:hypothetical protein
MLTPIMIPTHATIPAMHCLLSSPKETPTILTPRVFHPNPFHPTRSGASKVFPMCTPTSLPVQYKTTSHCNTSHNNTPTTPRPPPIRTSPSHPVSIPSTIKSTTIPTRVRTMLLLQLARLQNTPFIIQYPSFRLSRPPPPPSSPPPHATLPDASLLVRNHPLRPFAFQP